MTNVVLYLLSIIVELWMTFLFGIIFVPALGAALILGKAPMTTARLLIIIGVYLPMYILYLIDKIKTPAQEQFEGISTSLPSLCESRGFGLMIANYLCCPLSILEANRCHDLSEEDKRRMYNPWYHFRCGYQKKWF